MKIRNLFPTVKESIIAFVLMSIYVISTAVFVGFRPEHALILTIIAALFFSHPQSRKLLVGLAPFILFGISYDWMRLFPNYMLNPIDIEPLYNLEKSLFGIIDNGNCVIPCEYFAIHNNAVADFIAGISYLAWVPVPIAFGMYLYIKKRKDIFIYFAWVFLFVNILGYIVWYMHPAAPPWYVMEYGFEPILETPGNMAGLSRFDELLGIPIYASIYGRNANIFAALPSLHSAYLIVVFFYAIKGKCGKAVIATAAIFMLGIWFTAVYTAHHYIIDVILGIVCAIVGILLFEYVLMKLSIFKVFFGKIIQYIT